MSAPNDLHKMSDAIICTRFNEYECGISKSCGRLINAWNSFTEQVDKMLPANQNSTRQIGTRCIKPSLRCYLSMHLHNGHDALICSQSDRQRA